MIKKQTIQDIEIQNKTVLMRVDFNMPLIHGNISDNSKMVSSLRSIRYVLEKGGRLILMSHLGRPSAGKMDMRYSLNPCAQTLGYLLGGNTKVILAKEPIGEAVKKQVKALKKNEILILENTRFHAGELAKEGSEDYENYAKELASLADVYVNDAFGTAHRRHASVAGVAKYLPGVMGFLMEREIEAISILADEPERPFLAILGGAKVRDKLPVITHLLKEADKVLLGGSMIYTFYKAMGLEVGTSLVDEDLLPLCRDLLQKAGDKLVLPVDIVVGTFDFNRMITTSPLETVPFDKIPKNLMGLDVGQDTIEIFRSLVLESKTLFWNGPMGIFECIETAKGTFLMGYLLSEATTRGAKSVIGGGDSIAAINKIGLAFQISHVSTGGGSCLEFLQSKTLVALQYLRDKAENTR